jgi:hypothetical protein
MKKKQYEKPSFQVVELKQRPVLLAGSATGSVSATMDDEFVEEDI